MSHGLLSPQLEPTGILRMFHRLETMSVKVGEVLPPVSQRKRDGAATDLIGRGTFRASWTGAIKGRMRPGYSFA